MTNKEAREFIIHLMDNFVATEDELQACKMAIKALEQETKTGHWVEYKPGYHKCSNCNKDALVKWNTSKKDNVDILTKYCPNCGYRMVEPQESEG